MYGISKSINRKKTVDMGIRDFTIAFDNVPHKTHIPKIRYVGDMHRLYRHNVRTFIKRTRCKYVDPCYARATVVRARFLAAAFSDGSYLAHVNGAYLRHVTFCTVRGPPLFIVSPICQRVSRVAAHLTCRGTPASPILAVMK